MAPPLRSERDQEALLEALNSGVIDLVASDHAPHGCVDKEVELEMAANGILGLQTTLPLLLGLVSERKMRLSRVIESLTVAPARLLKLDGLGTLRVGAHADLAVIDLNEMWTLNRDAVASLSGNSPFLGRSFKGKVVKTMVEGVWK
jgi:dihydroorotase